MPMSRLKEFLDDSHVSYVSVFHPPAYSAQEVAHAAHIPGGRVAKTVLVRLDDEMALAVVPACERVDLECLVAETGRHCAQLATEEELPDYFPDCETGAMPPFGNLFGLPVFVSDSLAQQGLIAFSAGTHTEVVALPFADFRRLVEPHILHFSN